MTNKNELNEKELNEVSGGYNEVNNPFRQQYPNKINKDNISNYINQTLYFDCLRPNDTSLPPYSWILGLLLNIYEKSSSCGNTLMAKVKVINAGGCTINENPTEISLDTYNAYTD